MSFKEYAEPSVEDKWKDLDKKEEIELIILDMFLHNKNKEAVKVMLKRKYNIFDDKLINFIIGKFEEE